MIVRNYSRVEWWLRDHVKHVELGRADQGEILTVFELWVTQWFSVCLHLLWAPRWSAHGRVARASSVTVVLSGGYFEQPVEPDVKWYAPRSVRRQGIGHVYNRVTPLWPAWSLVASKGRCDNNQQFIAMPPLYGKFELTG